MSWPLIGQLPPDMACDWLIAASRADGAVSVTGQQSWGGDGTPVMTEVKPNISQKTPDIDIDIDIPSDELILSESYICTVPHFESRKHCVRYITNITNKFQ